MIGILLFIGFGYLVMSYHKPFHVAAMFAAFNTVIPLLFGLPFGAAIVGFLIMFIYASFVYYLLDSYGDGIFLFIIILLLGGLGLFFLPLLLS